MSSALHNVRKFFPEVYQVRDAKAGRSIEVTPKDNSSADVKSHKSCAMAVACKRKLNLDGAIISIHTAYLVKDGKATRYFVPQSVSREITSFDRKADFKPGKYRLTKPPKAHTLGFKNGVKPHHRTGTGRKVRQHAHRTEGIRKSLNARA